MPITMSNPGDVVTVVRITGNAKIRQHLSELGFVEGEAVTVVSKIGDNMIIKVKESRIALDVSMAKRILIG